MGTEAYIAIGSLLVPMAIGVLMAIHPEWRLFGWALIAVCAGVFGWSTATYLLPKLKPDSAALMQWLAVASGMAAALLLVVVGFLAEGVLNRPADARGAYAKMHFFGDDRIPTLTKIVNVANEFAYFSPSGQIREDAKGGPGRVLLSVPKTWAVFLAYDRPTEVTQVVVSFNSPGLPPYQVLQSTKRGCLVSFAGEIPSGDLEIDVQP